MTVTVTLSDSISERLLKYARKSGLPLDALVEKLVDDALPIADESDSLTQNELPSFGDILAEVRAIPPNPSSVTPATKTVDELVATLEADPPSDELMTFEEMWPLWQTFEEKLKEADEDDALRDRLG